MTPTSRASGHHCCCIRSELGVNLKNYHTYEGYEGFGSGIGPYIRSRLVRLSYTRKHVWCMVHNKKHENGHQRCCPQHRWHTVSLGNGGRPLLHTAYDSTRSTLVCSTNNQDRYTMAGQTDELPHVTHTAKQNRTQASGTSTNHHIVTSQRCR